MPKVRFNLHNPKAKETEIRLVFRYHGHRLVYYPGHKVSPACWNKQTQRVRRNATCRNADLINQRLDIIADKVEAIYLEYWNRGEPLPLEQFREELRAFRENRVLDKGGPVQLLDFIDQLVQERAGAGYSPKTLVFYTTLKRKLADYQKQTAGRVTFEGITLSFKDRFLSWLSAQGFKPNYINKIVRTLKAIMREALDRKLHENRDFQSKSFSAPAEAVEHIYLNEEELERIAAVALDERLDRVRDLFLLGCYTGLRFSDYGEIRAENVTVVDGVQLISLIAQKTRRRVYIPMTAQIRRILDKRGGRPPRTMSNQKFNEYVKEVAEAAGLREPVHLTRFKGELRVTVSVPKYKLVASHTARRSFASNEYIRAMREGRRDHYRLIMEITGHRTEKEFFKYIRVAAQEKAVLFAKGRSA